MPRAERAVAPTSVSERLYSTNFVLACGASFAAFCSFYFFLATLPVYIVELGGSEFHVGLIVGLFSAAAVILRLFVGKAADTVGKRRFMLLGGLGLTACSGLYALTQTMPGLIGLRGLHGASWALFGTASSALVADVVPIRRRGEAMGVFGMSANLAMAAGPALGAWLMGRYSFRVVAVVAAAVALGAFVASAAIREPERVATASTPTARGSWLDMIETSAVFPSAILGLVAVTYGSIVSFLPIFAGARGIANPGVFFTVYAVTLVAARTVTGTLSDRRGRAVVIVPGLVLAAAALVLLSTVHSLATLLIVAVLYGLGFASVQPAVLAMIVDRAPPGRRGAAMATYATAFDLGIGGGSVLWGIVSSAAGYPVTFVAAGALNIVALVLFLRRHESRGSSAPAAERRAS